MTASFKFNDKNEYLTDLMGLIYAIIVLFSNRSSVREAFIDELTSCFLKMKQSTEEVYNKRYTKPY